MTDRQEGRAWDYEMSVIEKISDPSILCWGCGVLVRMPDLTSHQIACERDSIEMGIIVAPSVKCFKNAWQLVGWGTFEHPNPCARVTFHMTGGTGYMIRSTLKT